MGNKLGVLLHAQYLSRSGINRFRHETDPVKKRRSASVAAAMVVAAVVLMGYCFALSYGFGAIGLGVVIPGYAFAITGIVTLLFTFMKSNGYLFACKDYDLLMAMPIPTEIVITARFLYMYLNNLLFTAGVMIPMGIGYAIWMRPAVSVYLIWICAIVVAPLLPMTIASAVGALITATGARFKYKVLVEVLLSVVLIFGISWVSMYFQNMSDDKELLYSTVTDLSNNISAQIHQIYPLSAWLDEAVSGCRIQPFLLLMIVPVLIYGIFALVIGRLYRRINTALMTYHADSDYRLGTLKTSSIHMALVKKEEKRFFSSSIYLMNMGMGLIMALGVSILLPVFGVERILGTLGLSSIPAGFIYAAPFALAMIINMCCTTSVSLSLEGKNLWIVQSLPVGNKVLYQSKMLFNMILVLPVSFVCSIIWIITLKVSFLQTVLYLLVSVATVLFSTVWGMWVNIRFPNFEWENEVEVIKQGASSMIGIFSGLLGYFVLAAATFFASRFVSGELLMLVFSGVILVLAALCYRAVTTKEDKK